MSQCIQCQNAYYNIKCPNCGKYHEDYHYAPGCNFVFFCDGCGFTSRKLTVEDSEEETNG